MICGCDIPVIEQIVETSIANSVSPGFMFDRQGNAKNNDWFKAGQIFSNVVGWPFGLTGGVVLGIWIGSQNVDTAEISIYEHEGDEVNLTLLTSVNIVAARNAFFDSTDFGVVNITQGYQLACRITSGNLKEPRAVLFGGGTP